MNEGRGETMPVPSGGGGTGARPARMRDVANLAGVGTMTVSRVINGSTNVSEETRVRVFDAIRKLSYRPNQIARSLRQQKSRQIGVIVPNIEDPFFAICAQAVSRVAKVHGYSVSIAMSDEDPEKELNEAMLMLQHNVDGLLVIPAAGPVTHLTRPEFDAISIVTLDRVLPGQVFDSVVVENRNGAQMAVQHLIDHGHREITYLGLSPRLYTIEARYQGYREAMRQAGLLEDVRYGYATQAEMLVGMREVLAQKRTPTALFCSNNLMTRHALHALSALHVKLPEAISLVGFDDFESADLIKPAVTVVRQPATELGRVAAEMLVGRLHGEVGSGPVRAVVLPVELVVRGSCVAHAATGRAVKSGRGVNAGFAAV